ncbi:MAG: hypothetical protein ACK40O_02935 [Allosphingosinicella sp.]
MSYRALIVAGAAAAALAGGAAAFAQAGKDGTAVYWMTAETGSGMAAAMGGGDPQAMAAAMMGDRGGQAAFAHTLNLQLGTGRRAPGEPSAEHVPPAGLKAGASLPLVTPKAAAASGPATPWNGQIEKPKGRMLIYWGCGDKARAGQPVVVDFASLMSGKAPAGFTGASFKAMVPPSAGNHATYGEWPNQRSQTRVPPTGSLVGEHVVRGNYTPEIRFTLGQGQDFLAPVQLTAQSAAASGAVPLAWRAVPGAKAWFATTMGAAENGDFIMWSSSEVQMPGMGIDHLEEGELNRLVQQKVLMPASASSCTVPAEVARAAPQSMLSLTALGGQANFSHPARPAQAPASWRPEWTVKLRTKSTHMGMLGMDMADLMSGRDADDADEAAEARPARKPKKKDLLKKGLGGLLGN